MTTNDIDAIRRRVPAVYNGPWDVQPADDGRWLVGYPTDNPKAGLVATVPDYGEHLAEFIAAARTDVPALLAEVDELTAERDAFANAAEQNAVELDMVRGLHRQEIERLTAERDAARDMATTARNEAAQALRALDQARAVVEAAKAWVRSSPPDFGRTGDALTEAVEALTEASGDDKPCCGYCGTETPIGVTR